MQYIDDTENFNAFLNDNHPFFRVYSGKDWGLLRRVYVEGKLSDPFWILSSSDKEWAVPGSSVRELRYSYRDDILEMNIRGSIVVSIAEKKNESEGNYSILTLSTCLIPIALACEDGCDTPVLHIEPINKEKLPLFMVNIRKGFEEELKKL